MAIDATTGSNLREYEEQLNKLDSDDIRIPNQSLILDYFCTDHELTDFLRDEVFLESSIRHTTWKKINQKAGNESKMVIDDEIPVLLGRGNNFSSRIWADIVRLTASLQEHQEIVEYINRASSSYEQSINAVYEQWSLEPVQEPPVESRARNIEDFGNNSGAQVLLNANSISQIQQPNRNSESARIADNRLPMLITSFALLGGLLALAVSVGNYETTSSIQENTSSIPTASDSSIDVQRLSDLEAQQKSAVLICEHQPIIDKAESLSLVEPQNSRRRDALIDSSNKQIEFLDQKSAKNYKYSESPDCKWGSQWFDNSTDSGWRAFIAVSKKCASPVIHYGITKTADSADTTLIRKRQIPLGNFEKGEVKLPYFDTSGYALIEKVSCSA